MPMPITHVHTHIHTHTATQTSTCAQGQAQGCEIGRAHWSWMMMPKASIQTTTEEVIPSLSNVVLSHLIHYLHGIHMA